MPTFAKTAWGTWKAGIRKGGLPFPRACDPSRSGSREVAGRSKASGRASHGDEEHAFLAVPPSTQATKLLREAIANPARPEGCEPVFFGRSGEGRRPRDRGKTGLKPEQSGAGAPVAAPARPRSGLRRPPRPKAGGLGAVCVAAQTGCACGPTLGRPAFRRAISQDHHGPLVAPYRPVHASAIGTGRRLVNMRSSSRRLARFRGGRDDAVLSSVPARSPVAFNAAPPAAQTGDQAAAVVCDAAVPGLAGADAAVALWQDVEPALSPLVGKRGALAILERTLALNQPAFDWLRGRIQPVDATH